MTTRSDSVCPDEVVLQEAKSLRGEKKMPGAGDYWRPRERLEPECLGWNDDNDEICDEPRPTVIELTLNDVWVRDPGVVALTEICKFSTTVTYALRMRPGAGGLGT